MPKKTVQLLFKIRWDAQMRNLLADRNNQGLLEGKAAHARAAKFEML